MDAHETPATPPAPEPVFAPGPPLPAQPDATEQATTTRPRRARRVLAGTAAVAFVVGGAIGGGAVAIAGSGSGSGQVAGSGQGMPGGTGPGGSAGGPAGGGAQSVPGGSTGEGATDGGSTSEGATDGGSTSGDDTAYGASTSTTVATAAQEAGVVVVDTVTDDGEAAGTGIVLTSSGEVVTNAHVVAGATSVRVTVPASGATYTAKVLGSNATSDIAVLQLERASGLTTATLDEGGTDTSPAVGDAVTAVGNAGGTGELVAATGTVEQLDAAITTSAGRGETSESLTGLDVIDADVVAGDSGGPLLDADGEVVGIDTAATSGSFDVTGYAIPLEDALATVHRILAAVDAA